MWLWESHRKCWSEPHEGPLPLQVGSYLHFWLDWIVEGNVNSFQFWEISSVALGRILWFEKNKYFVWIPTCHFNCVTVYQRHWDTGYPPRRARFVEQMAVELLSLVLFVTVSAMQSRGDYSHVKWGGEMAGNGMLMTNGRSRKTGVFAAHQRRQSKGEASTSSPWWCWFVGKQGRAQNKMSCPSSALTDPSKTKWWVKLPLTGAQSHPRGFRPFTLDCLESVLLG